MKLHPLTFALPIACLLVSCGEKEADPAAANDQAAANPSANPATQPKPKPAPKQTPKPKVNVAKLNNDLNRALSFGEPDKALAAIEAGADPNAKNRHGLPLIFSIASAGNGEMIKALVAKGANPNAKIGTTYSDDDVGYGGTADGTPLGYAAAKGNLETMQALVSVGAEVNGAGPEGTTPLMQSTDSGKYAVVEWLLNQGADPNAKDKHGGTALSRISMIVNPDAERQKILQALKEKTQ